MSSHHVTSTKSHQPCPPQGNLCCRPLVTREQRRLAGKQSFWLKSIFWKYMTITKNLYDNHTNLHNNHENPDQNPNTEPSLFQSWGRSCEWTAWTRNLAYLVVEVWSDHHYCQPTPPSCWSPGNTTEWLYKWDRSTPNGPTIGFFLRPGDLSERSVFCFFIMSELILQNLVCIL